MSMKEVFDKIQEAGLYDAVPETEPSDVSSTGLLSDAERLDYLEKYLARISREHDGELDYFEVCANWPMGYGEGETLRDAIDECIKVGRQNESDNAKSEKSE